VVSHFLAARQGDQTPDPKSSLKTSRMIIAAANISANAFDAAFINQSFASPISHLLASRIKKLSRRHADQLNLMLFEASQCRDPCIAIVKGRKFYRRSAAKRTSAEHEDKQVSGGFANVER